MSKRGLWIAGFLTAGLCAEAAPERFADSVAFDAALSWVGSPGHFVCPPAYSNDTYRYTLDLIADTGVTHVRERNRWREIAPTPDAWTPGRYLDNAKLAAARGIRLGGMFHDAPPYARTDTRLPRDLLATYRFCKRLAETLGDRMEMWEFWNEQDIGSTDEGAWDYAAAMKAAALGFRAGGFGGLMAPGALCRDDSGAYDLTMAENDPFAYADVANFHCYEPTSQYDAHLEMRRRYLRDIGFGHLPIVLTECGTRQEGMSATPSVSKGNMAHSPEQESVQSEFVVKSQILSRMAGVLRNYFFVFGAYNEFGGRKDWGLIRRDGTAKPAVGAFKRLIAEVGDGTLAGEVAVAGGKVRAFRFDMPDGRVKVAYWRRTGLDDGTAEIKDHSDPAEPFALRLEDGREVRLVAHREAAYATLPGSVAVSVQPRPTGTPGARTDPSLDTTVVIRADYDKSQVVLGNNKSRLEMKGDSLDLTVEVWNLDTEEKTGRIDFVGVGRVEGIPGAVRLPALGKVSFPVRYRLAESGGEPRFALVGAFGGRRTTRLVIPLLSEMAYARSCTVVETGWRDLSRWTKNASASSVDISWDEKENAVRMRHRWTAKDNPDRWFFNRFRLDLPKESLADGRYLVFEVKSAQDKVENDYNSARVWFCGKSSRYLTHFPPVSGWETRIVDIRPETRADGVTELQFGAHPRGYDVTYWIRNVRIFNAKETCDIAAFVWPAYQPEPRWAELGIFKDGKGEWQNVAESVKRHPDDLSELRPLWGFENEADPKVVERKIDTAVKYGVNVFIYDWYWYGGRPFLADALEKGFLGARNSRKMKFFVMWANHNVTHLWDNTVGRAHKKDVVWSADVSDEDYAKIVETWIGYFRQPNYYRIDGKPVLCIYLEPRFLARGEATAKARIALLRRRAAEEGFSGVHLMANGRPSADLGYDSMTVYNWGFAGAGDRVESRTEPPLDFDAFADLGFSLMERDSGYARSKGMSYFPNLTIGWDNNSRFPASETNNIVHGTSPESFERAARRLKEWMAAHRDPKAPQLLTVNSWNEWTEGSYLEPSDRLGFGFLEVIRRVFGEPMEVKAGGRQLKVEEARCSAVRKNQRWPGHQRPKGETEICSFVRFDMAQPTEVEVTVPHDFKEVVVKPLSKKVKAVREGRKIRFTLPAPGGYSVEFDGFHENLHVFADPPANYEVSREDPNVRWFGPGEHDVGPIEMHGGETLYLEDGAVVYGRVFARDADNIRILGRGILDASRVKEEYIRNDPAKDAEERARKFAVANVKRYDTIRLEFCDHVRIDGITIRDSQIYNIRPIGCRDVEIGWVKTVGNWRYNSDGFDLHNCENVRIHDCFIRTFDDAICVKGWDCWMDEREMLHDGYAHDTFKDVLVERCTIWNDWGKALEIGAETRAREIRDVVFRDCDVIRTSGAALDIDNVDYADVHDVTWDDIRVEYDPEPAGRQLLSLRVVQHPEYSAGGTRRGKIRDILFRNIRVTGPEMPVSGLRGHSADAAVRNVRIENLTFNGKKVGSVREMNLSVREFADEPVFADEPDGVVSVEVTETAIGSVKPLNGVNNGPAKARKSQSRQNFEAFRAANIPYARTHDAAFSPTYGGEHTVDITAVFPNFDADENDPASYDFACTDRYLATIREAGTETFYRLGQKIEHSVRKYGTLPPKDFAKWARICEHVIRHYNEGWAGGFRYNLQYWEIWNEPDLDKDDAADKRTWGGTKAEFFAFYRTAALHLKAKFPHLKIGGPAAVCVARLDWTEDFLKEMARAPRVPLDFFSWHIYFDRIALPVALAGDVRRLLDKYGYVQAESIYDEWNYRKDWSNRFVKDIEAWTGLKGGALVAATMCAMSRTSVDKMMYYDARPETVYNGLFDFYSMRPLPGYWSIFYWGDMLKKGTGLKVVLAGAVENDVEAFAAVGADGSKGLLVACYDDTEPLPPGDKTVRIAIAGGVAEPRLRMTDSTGLNREAPVSFADGVATLKMERLSVAYLTWR